jgi:hypothetical protein
MRSRSAPHVPSSLSGDRLHCVRPLTTELTQSDRRPYFLWDEDTSIAELRSALSGPDEADRLRLLGKMLREARDTDVWHFVSPEDVSRALPSLGRHLGHRRRFWEFVIGRWRALGLVR